MDKRQKLLKKLHLLVQEIDKGGCKDWDWGWFSNRGYI